MNNIAFTKREEELMGFLWQQTAPMTIYDMAENCGDRGWSINYLRVLVKSLEKKGVLRCCGAEPNGRQYSRQFCVAMTKEEYYVRLALAGGVNAGAFAKVAAAAVDGGKQNDDTLIQKLEEILADFKARNGHGV